MASQINPASIDATFPLPRQNNPTQGFRDNFSAIKNNFSVAASEISSMQTILASQFSGDYNDLVNKPTIPTDVNQLADADGLLGGVTSYNDLTDKPVIPTDVNDLTDVDGLLGGGGGGTAYDQSLNTTDAVKFASVRTPILQANNNGSITFKIHNDVLPSWITTWGDYNYLAQPDWSDDYAQAVAIDSTGSVVSVGADGNGEDFRGAFVFKQNADGTIAWQKRIRHPGAAPENSNFNGWETYMTGDAIAVDSQNNVIAGVAVSDFYEPATVIKFDPSGNVLWQRMLYNGVEPDTYNNQSPRGTKWNAQGWGNLTNVASRGWDYLYFAMAEQVNEGLEFQDKELLMWDTVNNKYYKMEFTQWGYYEDSMSYTRTQIHPTTGATIGTPVTFTKTLGSDPLTNYDEIDVGLKLTRDGNILFNAENETISGDAYLYGGSVVIWDITVDSQDNILLSVYMEDHVNDTVNIIKLDPSGNLLWSKKQVTSFTGFNGYAGSICVDLHDDIIVVGQEYINNTKYCLVFSKLDPSGTEIWSKSYELSGVTYQTSLYTPPFALDSAGNICVTPDDASYPGVPVALKISGADGSIIWEKSLGVSTQRWPAGVGVDAQDNMYFMIEHRLNGVSFILLKLDTNGNKVWERGISSTTGWDYTYYSWSTNNLDVRNGMMALNWYTYDNVHDNAEVAVMLLPTDGSNTGTNFNSFGHSYTATTLCSITNSSSVAVTDRAGSIVPTSQNFTVSTGYLNIDTQPFNSLSSYVQIAVSDVEMTFRNDGRLEMSNYSIPSQVGPDGYTLLVEGGDLVWGKAAAGLDNNANIIISNSSTVSSTNVINNVILGVDTASNTVTGGGTLQNSVVLGTQAGQTVIYGYYDNYIGYQAGYQHYGSYNTAIGYGALYGGSGDFNVAIGDNAQRSGTGYYAISIGRQSAYQASGGYYNIAIGDLAQFYQGNGVSNISMGRQSLYSINNGSYNTGIGDQAGFSISSGSYNTGIGYQALYSVSTGSYNLGLGVGALQNNSTGSYNIGIGPYAMASNATSGYSVAIGTNSLRNLLTGAANVAIGTNSMYNCTSGGTNVAMGWQALYLLGSGNSNIGIGYTAGQNITSGSNNTIIGSIGGTSAMADTVLIAAGATERVKVDATGLYINGTPKPTVIAIACSDEITSITTGTAKTTFRVPMAMKLTTVRASLSSAQSSGAIFTLDIKRNGTSLFSTLLTIDNNEKTSKTATTQAVLSTTNIADDDEITVDVTQVGDGSARGLKIYLVGV